MHAKFWVTVLALSLIVSRAQCGTIAQAKSAASGTLVVVQGTLTYVDTNECYLEATDRSGGIFVVGPTDGAALGDVVEARGNRSTVGGEQAIVDATITPLQNSSNIAPFGISNRGVGGAAPSGLPAIWDYVRVPKEGGGWEMVWMHAGGARNTGLLVTTWGTVKSVYGSPSGGFNWFYLDDGSAVVSDLGDVGVPVYSDAEVSEGDFVTVTGVSSVEPSLDDASKLIRVVRTRSADDVSVLRHNSTHERPFSDEFDKPTLDPRWALQVDSATGGAFSLTQEPGWAVLVPTVVYSSSTRSQLVQYAPGGWDAEIKVRLIKEELPGANCGLAVRLSSTAPVSPACLVPYVTLPLFSFYYDSTVIPPFQGIQGIILSCTPVPIPVDQDTCWFRIRWGGAPPAYLSYSTDGLNYSYEVVVGTCYPEWKPYYQPFFSAYVYNGGVPTKSAVAIDYVRFSPYTTPEE